MLSHALKGLVPPDVMHRFQPAEYSQSAISRCVLLLNGDAATMRSFCCRDNELYVTAYIASNGIRVGLPCSSSYKSFATDAIKFNDWLTFPIKYRDLTPTSRM